MTLFTPLTSEQQEHLDRFQMLAMQFTDAANERNRLLREHGIDAQNYGRAAHADPDLQNQLDNYDHAMQNAFDEIKLNSENDKLGFAYFQLLEGYLELVGTPWSSTSKGSGNTE